MCLGFRGLLIGVQGSGDDMGGFFSMILYYTRGTGCVHKKTMFACDEKQGVRSLQLPP